MWFTLTLIFRNHQNILKFRAHFLFTSSFLCFINHIEQLRLNDQFLKKIRKGGKCQFNKKKPFRSNSQSLKAVFYLGGWNIFPDTPRGGQQTKNCWNQQVTLVCIPLWGSGTKSQPPYIKKTDITANMGATNTK